MVSVVWRRPETVGPGRREVRYHSGAAKAEYAPRRVATGSRKRNIILKGRGRTRDIFKDRRRE